MLSSRSPEHDRAAGAHERRLSSRLETHLRVDYCQLASRDGSTTLSGSHRAVATNISATGLRVSGSDLQVGSLLHLTLRLPDMPGNAIACDAKVVRSAESPAEGVGCRILQIHQWDSRRLAEFVSRCARAQQPV